MPEKDFFSFEEALDELRLKEEELKRLVSEGEIRAFRDGETMRLRRADVDSLRAELSGGEVIDLGDATEELVFEDDEDLETGMATEEISDMDTLLDDEIEDVGEIEEIEEIEEVDPEPAPEPAARPRATAASGGAVRRTSSKSGAGAEAAPTEGPGTLILMMATTVILVLALPVVMSANSGKVGGLAKGIAGIFGAEFPAD